MDNAPHVLVFDGGGGAFGALPARLQQRGLSAVRAALSPTGELSHQPAAGDVAVVLAGAGDVPGASWDAALCHLVEQDIPTLVVGAGRPGCAASGPLMEWVASDVDLDEVVGKLGTMIRYVPLVRSLQRELNSMQRLGTQLNQYFGEIDQEMRLAGRLQRDFLPRSLPCVGPFHFEACYRPASWVSGDLYDVFRIDEHHVGLFVADAMGHGVAAGLLTMFLRQALVAKRITGSSYAIVPPTEAMGGLHDCLVRQRLPNAQFITAAYGVVDLRTGELRLARAGHPYPVHVRADGSPVELRSAGSLLGLADVPVDFEELCVLLHPGEKLVVYTDGMEDSVISPGSTSDEPAQFTEHFRRWARLSATGFVQAVTEYLDGREGSLHPADDVTLLVLEVGPTEA